PDITLEIDCNNALVELVAGGFDAGIRLGENLAQDVVAVPLGGRQRIAIVASPGYLEGRAAPGTPEDLRDHLCLNARLSGALYRWEFEQKGRVFDMDVKGPLVTNDGDVLLAAVRAGGGIACAFEVMVQADIAAGRLVPLLRDWWPTFPGFYLYYPSRAHMPRKLRVFIDFMQRCNAA
ncbi:MAG: LysR family transcriptional regulator, partial [Polaromonas sp.]|nr:LysR family transcriptional regulator [Polaromonas sp.]